MKSKFK